MPKHDPTLYADRREQIIDGALRVFSTKGFLAATNRDIAGESGINSAGLIYHYFANKEDLLRAVIERYAPPVKLLIDADEIMALPPAEALPKIGRAYVELIRDTRMGACARVLFGEALRSPAFADILREIAPMRILKIMAMYLERQMQEGRLRQANPMVAARCMIAPLASYALTRVIFNLPDGSEEDMDVVVQTCIDIFLHGLQSNDASVPSD